MSVMIGIDPHKLLHAACAIDRSEAELGQLQVRSGPRQLHELLSWAARFEQRTWAIESAGGLGYLLAQQLLGHGETVLDVPPTLSARRLSTFLRQVCSRISESWVAPRRVC